MAVMKFLIYVTCFGLSQVFCDDYGESGKEITLTPIIRGKPEEILWILNNNKVLEYDGSQVETFGSFKDRVDVDFETGQLTIRKLNSQDSGSYQSVILINEKQQVSSHILTVLDALPEPRVTCELGETTNDKTLTCSVESQTPLSYEWIGPDVKQTGPTLLVSEKEENRNPVYTCTVKNKAASRTTDFALQDCHTVNLAVLVPVSIIVSLLIIVLALLALYLYRRKKLKSARKAELKRMDLENGVRDTLMENYEAVPGSLEATLPCRTRLTAPKESIADKKWGQGSESENAGETHEEEKLLKESLQSAKTENEEAKEKTNEGELEINQENCGNTDEAGENANSKADETEEVQKYLQTQEGIEKSQILKDESEDKESSEEQTETAGERDATDTDTNDEDQTPEEEEEKEEENEDSLNTGKTQTEALGERGTTDTDRNDEDQTPEEEEENSPNTGNVEEQLHKNEKSSQNENRDQSTEQQNKCLYRSVDEEEMEDKEKTEKETGTGRPHTDSPPNLDCVELENKQTECVPQQEDDDDGEQTDKSSESEQGMEEKRDVATAR